MARIEPVTAFNCLPSVLLSRHFFRPLERKIRSLSSFLLAVYFCRAFYRVEKLFFTVSNLSEKVLNCVEFWTQTSSTQTAQKNPQTSKVSGLKLPSRYYSKIDLILLISSSKVPLNDTPLKAIFEGLKLANGMPSESKMMSFAGSVGLTKK